MNELINTYVAGFGITVLGIASTGLGVILWFKKNIVNLKQLKADGSNVSEQIKYSKAVLKDNNTLKLEINNQKIHIQEMTKIYTQLINKKDQELISLKTDVKELIKVIKEGVKL